MVVAVLAAFAPGIHTPFQYDDLSTVVENVSIRDLSNVRLALSPPPNETPTSGRPLLNLSFAIDYAITGMNVVGYHVTNIALHVACALLLFVIVRSTAFEGSDGTREMVAAASGTIWAVHPLQTGAVTYISGRSDVLVGLWFFATLLAAIRAHRSPPAPAWTLAAIAACGLGMACKESMVTAPVAVLLYDRAYVYDRFSDAFRNRWRLYAGLAATWAIAAALLLQAPHSESAGFSTGVSPWTYLVNQAVVLPDYFRRVIWPDHLLFAYGEVRRLTVADLGATALVVPLLLAGAIWLWLRRPRLGFPAIWVFLTLAPTSSIVPIATEAGAARRMYLPLAGIVVLFVIAVVTLADRVSRRNVARRGRAARRSSAGPASAFARRATADKPRGAADAAIPVAIFSTIVVALGATTAAQSREFSSAEQLWRSSLERWPSALSHRNLAAVLLQQGRHAEALEHLRAATDGQPLARYSLGVELFDQGRASEAIVELRRVIQEFPTNPTIALEGRRVLARALQAEGRHREAADVLAQMTAMQPTDVTARLSRADELLAAGDLGAAHEEYQRILAMHPDHTGAMTNDGLTLLRLGRPSEALALLRTVAEQQPKNVDAAMNLASAAAAAGRFTEAVAAACHAIDADPQKPSPRQFLEDLRLAASASGVRLPDCPQH